MKNAAHCRLDAFVLMVHLSVGCRGACVPGDDGGGVLGQIRQIPQRSNPDDGHHGPGIGVPGGCAQPLGDSPHPGFQATCAGNHPKKIAMDGTQLSPL